MELCSLLGGAQRSLSTQSLVTNKHTQNNPHLSEASSLSSGSPTSNHLNPVPLLGWLPVPDLGLDLFAVRLSLQSGRY